MHFMFFLHCSICPPYVEIKKNVEYQSGTNNGAKPHDATKMPQLLCVKLEDPKKLHPRPWGDHVLSYTWPAGVTLESGRYFILDSSCANSAILRGEKILLLAYARSCQHMGESETAINAAPRAVSELRKSNFIPRELSSFLKESVKTAHFNLIAASLWDSHPGNFPADRTAGQC